MRQTMTSARALTGGSGPAPAVQEALTEVGESFERFCLTAGIATLGEMMEEDEKALAGDAWSRASVSSAHFATAST